MRVYLTFNLIFLLSITCPGPAQSIVKVMIEQPEELKASIPQKISSEQAINIDLGDSILIAGGTPPYSYYWKSGQSVLSETRSFEIVPTRIPASYTIRIVDSKNCSTENPFSILVGVEEINSLPVNVYPVPATSFIIIEPGSEYYAHGKVTVYDMSGQKKLEQALSGRTTLPLLLPAGMYLLEIDADGKKSTRKIIISGRN